MKSALMVLIAFAIGAQSQTLTDSRDKKKYKTVKIGEQTWMAQNLDYHGADGFLGLCYGDEPKKKIRKPENCKKYGRLYNWKEAMEACPSGWHLPSDEEWQTLVDFAGGDEVAGKKLKAKSGWTACDFPGTSPKVPKCKWTAKEELDDRGRVITPAMVVDKYTTDEYGFSALPGGSGSSGGSFYTVGYGYWWSSSEDDSNGAYRRYISSSDVRRDNGSKIYLLSVRCVQD